MLFHGIMRWDLPLLGRARDKTRHDNQVPSKQLVHHRRRPRSSQRRNNIQELARLRRALLTEDSSDAFAFSMAMGRL